MFLCPDKIGNVLEELLREKQSSLKRSLKVDAKLFRLGIGLVVGLLCIRIFCNSLSLFSTASGMSTVLTRDLMLRWLYRLIVIHV